MEKSGRRQVLNRVVKAVFIVGAACQIAQLPILAQDTAKKEKKVKDQGEYDIFTAANKEADPTKQLAILQTWKEKYPDSDFKQERADAVAMAYSKLKKTPETIKAVQDALAINPKDLTCLQLLAGIAGGVLRAPNPTDEILAQGDQASALLISNLENFFDASVKPAAVDAAAWAKAKADTQQLALTVQGYSKWKKKDKDYPAAEAAFRKVLAGNGENLQVSLWLASVFYSGEKKFSEGLFEYARAASYTGPGALDPKVRQSTTDFLKKAYEAYHGKVDDGLEELKKAAASNALPPDGFHIDSVIDVQKKEEGDAATFAAAHPDIAFFRTLKEALKAETGQTYFESGVKDAMLPPQDGAFKQFKGRLVAQNSAKELLLSIDDAAGDVTLVLDTPLRPTTKLDPGLEISFNGVPDAFTKDPFNLKFKVEKANVTGLPKETGAPVRRAPARKAAPKN